MANTKDCGCGENCICKKRRYVTGRASNMFKILGDPTKLEILFALEEGNLCVSDLVNLLGFSQSLISHQLKIMRDNNIVVTNRQGNKVYYQLADDHVVQLLDIAKDHAAEHFLDTSCSE